MHATYCDSEPVDGKYVVNYGKSFDLYGWRCMAMLSYYSGGMQKMLQCTWYMHMIDISIVYNTLDRVLAIIPMCYNVKPVKWTSVLLHWWLLSSLSPHRLICSTNDLYTKWTHI
jgi:hypothetical protein